jgi:hypothetical protein
LPRFTDHGLTVAAITYDSAAILDDFSRKYKIEYPLLSDADSLNIRAFGLLDPDNGPDNRPDYAKENMAYPGYFWIGTDGIVKERYLGEKYFERFTANHVFARMYPDAVKSQSSVTARHVTIKTGQTDTDVIVGSRMELLVDLDIRRGAHLYAPTVSKTQALRLDVDATNARVRSVDYPAADREIKLAGSGESLAAYSKRVRIRADIMIAPPREVQKSLAEGPQDASAPMTIEALLHYQTCTDKVCDPPADAALHWRVLVRPPSRERAPENIQERPGHDSPT